MNRGSTRFRVEPLLFGVTGMKPVAAFFVIVLLSIGSSAYAQFTLYGDATRAQFFNDAGGAQGITTLSFTDFSNGTTVTDQYTEFGVTFEGLNFTSGPFTNYHDLWGLRILNWNDLYFDEPINWIAADFLGTLRFDIYSGDTFIHRFERPATDTFVGGFSEIPFDHVRIYDPVDTLAVIDDLHFGPPIVVPAPGAFAALTFTLFTASRKRRR